MKVCIAEKPSVAKDIAEVLGAKQRKDGYYEGAGYQVTWTFGHFCTLKEPEDYQPEWKFWRLDDLPMIPASFGIKLINNDGVKKQFGIIEKLIQDCEEVINCGDAGQEGELIQRWVLLKAKCNKPIKRLWISSLTEEAIREGFQKLKDSEQYNNLYAAGSSRAIGDWLLGMNATRLFTKKFAQPKVVLSIGRVQTPTLAMIVQRQKEINAFVSSVYWELKTLYRETEFVATIDRLHNQEKANKGLAYLKEHLFEIISVEKKDAKEGNPRLFDLTALQVEANKKFAYSADETLKHIQNLYEKKLVTYPRVDTTYLPEDMYPKIKGILQSMVHYKTLTASVLAQPIPKLKTVFDDKKVTDHHAIIPTDISPSNNLSPEEKRVYDLVARRFIAAFYPECKVANTTVMGKVGQVEFKATGKQVLEAGWREVYANDAKAKKDKEEGEEAERILPVFEVGERGPHEPWIHQGKTTPPKPFTEASLLRAMETAGKQVEDEEMRELLKDNGIGRPSTRANIIETLFRRKYIEKKKKNLFATQTGIDLIDTIQNELLKSAELTGIWERKLRLIEKGAYEAATFKQELIDMVVALTREVKISRGKSISIAPEPVAKPVTDEKKEGAKKERKPKAEKESISIEQLYCPKCKTHLLKKGNSAYGCANFQVCGFKIPFEILGKKLSDKQIFDLLSKGKTGKIKGLKIPGNEQEIDGKLVMDGSFNIGLE
ncbi:type IA DNA topoisomerase [Flavisolibacter tropicus]|uniref:DNA topoisomerase n=1 Tax=Flavisolibacter tropicus TaxID=1492898 RepID=A0A172U1H6_9BACT|nr:type IA DNA topoisomerase [Flavisolibacter tropicus]ANE53211.1 DNA topoisomerase III [Flavisolibacter tropicus]